MVEPVRPPRSARKKPIEQYDHPEETRKNNPPVGLVTPHTDRDAGRRRYAYDPHINPALQFDSQGAEIERIIDDALATETLDSAKAALAGLRQRRAPYLNWAGKAERTSFEVPTVSLHVHERIDPKTVMEAVRKSNGESGARQLGLFEVPEANPPLRDALDFYRHDQAWTNRLVAGDSLLVMNSLLEKEGMAGKVQMVYLDPPYGIRYGSNFQPFVNRRDVRDGRDEDLTQEPEMIRAFRDTWELGIHSYLTYLRDRLMLARELLHEDGSLFVQISDENLHLVRSLLDEVFGKHNFVVLICYRRLGMMVGSGVQSSAHYLIWFAKSRSALKHRKLFERQTPGVGSGDHYLHLQEAGSGEVRPMSKAERADPTLIPEGWRPFELVPLSTGGYRPNTTIDYEFEGRTYHPGPNKCWRTTRDGLDRISALGRIARAGNTLRYRQFLGDFPFTERTSIWDDTGRDPENYYVVQTPSNVIERCILMTTDPGDLVFDPTGGSGTTAFSAEQWGRRWITADTSRVAIALAKQRLMTANFDYYELAHPDEGVRSGFVYKTVPHITLKSLANSEPPELETLYDQPRVENSKVRVSGPFTVEAVPAPMVQPLEGTSELPAGDGSVARSGGTLRHTEWRAELLKSGVRGKNAQMITFSRVEPLAGTRWLHADAETVSLGDDAIAQRVVVSFGPEHAPLEQRQVEMAWEEAQRLAPRPAIILFAAFQFDPEAAKDIDELTVEKTGMTFLKVQMDTDLLTEDLKKKRASNQSFWLVGQPEVEVRTLKDGEHAGKLVVEVLGFDYYNTRNGEIESGDTHNIAMWMLDTDYDGLSLYPRQVFFPMAGDNEGWARLARSLRAEIDPNLIEAYRGTVSLPFEPGDHRRVAVKIVDDRGIESLKIVEV